MNNAYTPAVFGMTVQQVGRSNKFVVVDVRDRFNPVIVAEAFGKYYATVLRNIVAGYGPEQASQLARIEASLA